MFGREPHTMLPIAAAQRRVLPGRADAGYVQARTPFGLSLSVPAYNLAFCTGVWILPCLRRSQIDTLHLQRSLVCTHPASIVAGRVGGTFALAARAGGAPVHELVDTAAVLPVVQHAEDDPDAVPPRLQDQISQSAMTSN